MDFDIAASTVTIAGRIFPAVGLICPTVDGLDASPLDRLLGDTADWGDKAEPYAFVPCENGILIELTQDAGDGTYEVQLVAHQCVYHDFGGPQWTPRTMEVDGDRIVLFNGRSKAPWLWEHAEPDWLADHIDRMSRKTVIIPAGPRVQPIPLAEVSRLWREGVSAA